MSDYGPIFFLRLKTTPVFIFSFIRKSNVCLLGNCYLPRSVLGEKNMKWVQYRLGPQQVVHCERPLNTPIVCIVQMPRNWRQNLSLHHYRKDKSTSVGACFMLLCARPCANSFLCINSFHPRSYRRREVPSLSLFYRWGSRWRLLRLQQELRSHHQETLSYIYTFKVHAQSDNICIAHCDKLERIIYIGLSIWSFQEKNP